MLRLATAGAVALGLGMLAACAPEPAPTPTPTAAFASEEEAFAAAEEVYRAYNDAGNSRRGGDASPNPQDYLTGSALEGDIDAVNYLQAEGLRLDGDVQLLSFTGVEAFIEGSDLSITGIVCLDTSSTRVLSEDGTDVTPADHADVIAQSVTFMGTSGGLLIASESPMEADGC
jgi:hypothetical protein